MIRLSASGTGRALACPSSLVYPQHDYRTKYASDGTDRHAEDEAAIDVGDTSVLPDVVQRMINEGDQISTEAAFAYDVATDRARALGHGRASYRGLSPFEIPGTIDTLILGNGRAIVIDKKSFERVGAASENAQTMTYALMVARVTGYDEITVVIYYEIGGVDVAAVSALDLDAHADRLKALQVDVARATAEPTKFLTMGAHCKYCPAFLSCPKQHALTLEVSSADMAISIERRIPFDDDKDAAAAFDLLGRIKMLTARIQSALYARAGERAFALSDGRVLGPREKLSNEKIDGDIAYAVIRDQHGQGIADTAVERKATKKRLREALTFAGGKGEIAKLERAALAEIKKRGGIEQTTRTVVEPYEPAQIADLGAVLAAAEVRHG